MRRSGGAAIAAVVGLGLWLATACGSETSDENDGTPGGEADGGGGGGLINDDAAAAIDGNVYTPGDGAPGTCVPLVAADGSIPQCANCIDDDGDGLVDWLDPECAGPLDNDEKTFGTGIPGDNQDACKQDCFFDGNSGQGDDGCEWNLKCDRASTSAQCTYDPNFNNCPRQQSQKCIDFCQKLTPNGCDCFGCCAVTLPGGATKTVKLTSSCSLADIDDPTKCSPCTQTTSCVNDCGTCELCIGKTTLPPECAQNAPSDAGATGGQTCSGGQQVCNANAPCPSGTYCVTGCCIAVVR